MNRLGTGFDDAVENSSDWAYVESLWGPGEKECVLPSQKASSSSICQSCATIFDSCLRLLFLD